MLVVWDAVASAGLCAICTLLQTDNQVTTPTPHHSIFTGRMLFLTPNRQCQRTEVETVCIVNVQIK